MLPLRNTTRPRQKTCLWCQTPFVDDTLTAHQRSCSTACRQRMSDAKRKRQGKRHVAR